MPKHCKIHNFRAGIPYCVDCLKDEQTAVPQTDTPETEELATNLMDSPVNIETACEYLMDHARKLERARNHNRICVARMELERNELREALRKAIVWAESAAAQITDNRADINWSYLEDARKVLSSQNPPVSDAPRSLD